MVLNLEVLWDGKGLDEEVDAPGDDLVFCAWEERVPRVVDVAVLKVVEKDDNPAEKGVDEAALGPELDLKGGGANGVPKVKGLFKDGREGV